MNEQLKVKKPIKILGVKQNCYRLDVDPEYKKPKIKDDTVHTYMSLERKALPNGFMEQVEEKDYPINSASITSYADGADYRNDPAQAVVNAPKRVNLGDVTQIQDFIQNDPQQAVRVFRDVLAKLEKAQPQAQPQPQPQAQPQPQPQAHSQG